MPLGLPRCIWRLINTQWLSPVMHSSLAHTGLSSPVSSSQAQQGWHRLLTSYQAPQVHRGLAGAVALQQARQQQPETPVRANCLTGSGAPVATGTRMAAAPPATEQQQAVMESKPNNPTVPPAAAITTSEMQASAAGGFMTGVTTKPTGQGFKKTFYKRHLPSPPSIAFASAEGRQLFAEALAAGHMNGFFKLTEQFSTQDEPSFCGLASIAMVLNALAIDPRRTWKGAWRWFHEQMLDCCRPLEDVKREGITLAQAACLSRCNGARVVLHRHGTFSLEDLRKQVLDVCSTGEQHVVVSYSRRQFQQTGDGHFSPIGGYHAGKDLVLILDVARFKYPPHWVPLPMLYEAMKYVDPVTGQPRGFLRMSAHPLLSSVLLTLDLRSSCWDQANEWARSGSIEAVKAAAAAPSCDVEALVAQLLSKLPVQSLDAFLMVRDSTSAAGAAGLTAPSAHDRDSDDHECAEAADEHTRCLAQLTHARDLLLTELRAQPLYTMVSQMMEQNGQLSASTVLQCHQQTVKPAAATPQSPSATPISKEGGCSQGAASAPGDTCCAALPAAPATSAHQHGNSGYLAEKATALLLMRPRSEWPQQWVDEAAGKRWAALMDTAYMSILETELVYLREQWAQIDEVVQGGSVQASCGSGCTQVLDCAALGHC